MTTSNNQNSPKESVSTIFNTPPIKFPSGTWMKTEDFLTACSRTVNLLELFGKVFAPVVNDMKINIGILRANFECNTQTYEFVFRLYDSFSNDDNQQSLNEAFVWLTRELHLICRFFRYFQDSCVFNPGLEDISSEIKRAYSYTLKQHHGWVGKQLFHILTKFSLTRQQVFQALAFQKANCEYHIIDGMKAFTSSLKGCLDTLALINEEFV